MYDAASHGARAVAGERAGASASWPARRAMMDYALSMSIGGGADHAQDVGPQLVAFASTEHGAASPPRAGASKRSWQCGGQLV